MPSSISSRPSPIQRAYRSAIYCAALPMALGIGIFVLWFIIRYTRVSLLPMVAGYLLLYGGAAVVILGFLCLIHYLMLARRAPQRPPHLWRSVLLASLFLLANLPVAAGLMTAAYYLATCYTVTIRNASSRPLDEVQLTGSGCDRTFGPIAPGSTHRQWLWFIGDDRLACRIVTGPTTHDTVIEGYVTHHRGGRATVTIDVDGALAIRH